MPTRGFPSSPAHFVALRGKKKENKPWLYTALACFPSFYWSIPFFSGGAQASPTTCKFHQVDNLHGDRGSISIHLVIDCRLWPRPEDGPIGNEEFECSSSLSPRCPNPLFLSHPWALESRIGLKGVHGRGCQTGHWPRPSAKELPQRKGGAARPLASSLALAFPFKCINDFASNIIFLSRTVWWWLIGSKEKRKRVKRSARNRCVHTSVRAIVRPHRALCVCLNGSNVKGEQEQERTHNAILGSLWTKGFFCFLRLFFFSLFFSH